jgi:RNA recognition motif-containing protein
MNLFVSNISHSVNDGALRDLFSEIGQVTSVKIINDKYTGQSRGFGFVEMGSEADGQEAIKKLSNANFFGRNLVVSVARPKTDSRSSAASYFVKY